MRIAIAGTHCSGKSTLVEAFLGSHTDYTHEPEPYEALQEIHGECFADDPSADDFLQQLLYLLERLKQYRVSERVIFERSPFDFVAYQQALVDLRRDTGNHDLAKQSVELARGSTALLDMIVFLPASGAHIYVPQEEDLELREAMDMRLEALLVNDEAGIFNGQKPAVIEAIGRTAQRLETLGLAINRLQDE